MRAITLHQPWASLVAHGVKLDETRSWRTPYRGPLAIHAGVDESPWLEVHRHAHQYAFGNAPKLLEAIGHGPHAGCPDPQCEGWGSWHLDAGGICAGNWQNGCRFILNEVGLVLPLGGIVGSVDLVDIAPIREVARLEGQAPRPHVELGNHLVPVAECDLPLGDYSEGRYAWRLTDAALFAEPIRVRGRQGLWTVPPSIAPNVVRAKLLAARARAHG